MHTSPPLLNSRISPLLITHLRRHAMQEEELIHVHWDGPFSLDDVYELNNDWDYGVYQIYGCHTVYGAGVLLYIGRTVKRTFSKRIPEEGWPENQDGNRVEVYVGRLSGERKPQDKIWNKMICKVESLLIYAHSPANNSKNIKSIKEGELRKTHILNWGLFRDLLPEVSGHRWTERHSDMPEYRAFGKPISHT